MHDLFFSTRPARALPPVRPFLLVTLSALAAVALGCETAPAPAIDGGLDAPRPDAPFFRPDGSTPCTVDTECDDEVPCTNDVCNTLGFCESRTDASRCDDMIFCNGIEICHPYRGCIPGPRESCDDMDVCTIDRCNEPEKRCDHSPRDLDEDGDVDFFCPGGGDCDDRDATRSSLAREICMDTQDNNCDGAVDESMCGRAPYDQCTAMSASDVPPLDVSAGGTFVLSTVGAVNDYSITCPFSGGRDVVTTFTIPAGTGPRDLRAEAQGSTFTAVMALRSTCEDAATQVDCAYGFPGIIRRRSLPEGTYYLIIAGGTGATFSDITLTVALTAPTPTPTNESCAMPQDVPAGGGTISGSFVDVRDDLTAGCGFGGSLDLVYRFTVPSGGPRDVRISATAARSEALSFAVRSTCDMASTELQCAYGSPAAARLHELAPGDYFVIVEGPTSSEPDFSLNVEILPPTPRLAGDTCSNPIALTLGTPYSGSLSGMEHDLDTTCGYAYRDAVHQFTLTEPADVTVTVDGGSAYMAVSLRPTACTNSAGQLRCSNGFAPRTRLRGLAAGTYWVVVESQTTGAYSIEVDAVVPPVVSVAASGNDLCGTAWVVPETGGLFTGSTVGFLDDFHTSSATCAFTTATAPDVAFRLDLTTARRVVATTEGSSFDTVLYVHRDFCNRGGLELYCNDDGPGIGTRSIIERVLDPGTYYFVIDGYNMFYSGDYVFEVLVSAP